MFVDDLPDSINSFTHKKRVTINRPLYTEEHFTSLHGKGDEDGEKSLLSQTLTKCKEKVSDCSCASFRKRLISLFPFLSWIPKYKKSYLSKDLIAGLTLGVFQIPQGMAYGMLTTLPAIYGLYTSLVPVLVYFFMGSSRFLSIGTFAIITLMIGEAVSAQIDNTVMPIAGPNITEEYVEEYFVTKQVEVAVSLSFLVGIIQILFGLFRFGFITIFLSDPLISGFTTGAAFHIATSQMKHLVGMNIPRARTSGVFSLFKVYIYIFKNIKQANYMSFVIGLVAFIILFTIKHFTQKYKDKVKIPIPAELVVITLGLGLSYGLNFNKNFDVKILKNVPKGLPPLSLPSPNLMQDMITSGVTIALVSYAISVSVAKSFAKKHGDELDVNQELYAYGLSNIVSSFFSCFVSSASLSRSLIQENLAASQLSSIFSAGLIFLTLTVLAPIFAYLPNAILASIILVALKGLFRQFTVVKVLYNVSKTDAFIWIISFIAVLCLGVDYGLALGFLLNLLATIIRASRPSTTLMGNIDHTEIYTSIDYNLAQEIPGIKIFRFHAPLFYANTEYFQNALFKSVASPLKCVTIPIPESCQTHGRFESKNTIGENIEKGPNKDIGENIEKGPNKDDTNLFMMEDDGEASNRITVMSVDVPLICPTHTIILDCSQISYTDTMGVGCLIALFNEYQKHKVDVLLSQCSANLLETLQDGGFTSHCGMDNIFLTTHDAVNFAFHKPHYEGICQVGRCDKKENSMWEMVSIEKNNELNEDIKVDKNDSGSSSNKKGEHTVNGEKSGISQIV